MAKEHPREDAALPALTPSKPAFTLTRRELITWAGTAGSLLLSTLVPATVRVAPRPFGISRLKEGQRVTLRSLWDAVVPGTWEGIVEDWLAPGVPAPGADDAGVQNWVEKVSGSLPWPLDGLIDAFLGAWASDLDFWADVVHGRPFDGEPKFWELPLDSSIIGRGRQRKILLMIRLFGTLIDLKYQGGILLSKIAFYGDFWFEATEPQTRVGREYIGFPLPPGLSPYEDFSYKIVLGDPDPRLIRVNPRRNLLALP